MSPQELRKLLTKIENALGPDDALLVERLIEDADSSESRIIRMIEQVTEALTKASLNSEQVQDVVDRALAVLADDVKVRERAVQVADEANRLRAVQLEHTQKYRITLVERVVGPLVGALAGAAAGGAAASQSGILNLLP
jgi:hypothetical protein